MGLSQVLSTSMSGLRAAQTGMSLVASNVANAQTPGYIKKSIVQTTTGGTGVGTGVRVTAINRELDVYLQKQLRTETAGDAYAETRALFYQRLQQVYGEPGTAASLESVYNAFEQSLSTLTASPDSVAAQSTVIGAAQALAQQLNSMTRDIQRLRGDAEHMLSDAVGTANNAMRQIGTINQQLATMDGTDAASAALLDQRDAYIDELSRLMDINVVRTDKNQISIFTNSGIQLVGSQASTLSFDPHGTLNAGAQWSADPTESGVGTLKLVLPNGGEYDLIANGSIRSGGIAALIEMRDTVLVEAQNQIDALAAGLARALSDKETIGTAVTAGPQNGFEIDVGALKAGNTLNLSYFDTTTMQERSVTIVRVDDPSVLPLQSEAYGFNGDVVGIDFSGGPGSVASQLNAAFNGRFDFSNPSGDTLRVLDGGSGGTAQLTGLSSRHTVTGLSDGGPELPFFLDSHVPYTGAATSAGGQMVGFAGRIQVNADLVNDPSRLVAYASSTPVGDATRPDFLHQRLINAHVDFAPNTGLGSSGQPYKATVATFMQQVLSLQGEAAAHADNLAQGQKVVVNALKVRFTETSGVNIDAEMAALITLQTAYSANARVMSVAREMIDTLLRM